MGYNNKNAGILLGRNEYSRSVKTASGVLTDLGI